MLKVHFLNVGHGDCTFVELPSGRLMMIDINNSKSLPEEDVEALAESKRMSRAAFKAVLADTPKGTRSWNDYYESLLVDPLDYYREHFNGRDIFRYIQTHPDMDHLSGLFRFFYQEEIPVANFWDTKNTKTFADDAFDGSPYDQKDWLVYQLMREGELKDGRTHRIINPYAGDQGNFWTDDGVEILSPTPSLVDTCNAIEESNDLSFVIRVTYAGRSIILPGDAEALAWKEMLTTRSSLLSCDVLKASHHGRESGYNYEAVEAMNPAAVICSVGEKPQTDASDEYASHGAKVFSTRYHGTITVTVEPTGDISIEDRSGVILLSL